MPASDEPGAKPELGFARTVVSRDGETLRDTVSVEELREAAPDASLPYIETIAPEDNRATGTPKSSAELAFVETTDLSAPSRNQLMPTDPEEGRVKAMIKARLFKSRAQPAKIGRFTILDRLGEGGMGVVYGAYDEQLDRKVAVKILRGHSSRDPETGRARLLREAQAMARLSHPNIVTVHEVGAFEDQVYVAMEFVRGQSLDRWLAEEPRPWRAVLDRFLLAGRGLEAAHKAGIVHRDFKPHNVMVGDDGSVKVLDFGLARATGQAALPAGDDDPIAPAGERLLAERLTRTGAIMGTPAYMAPEQHQGLAADERSDQFSFCVALHEALYRVSPFPCESLGELVAAVLEGQLAKIPEGAKVPGWVRQVVVRGLAVDPAARHQSMTALLAELARDPAARRRRLLSAAALAGVVSLGTFGLTRLSAEAPRPCVGLEGEIASAWGDDRAQAVEAAMTASGVSYARDTWTRIGPRLDAYADGWATMRRASCEANVAGKQSDALYDRRVACLEERRAGLATLVDVLAGADAAVVERAAQAVASLPPLERCADAAALTAAVAPPEDPAVAREVHALRETLARAQAHELTGRFADGLALATSVGARTEALAYKPLAIEAKFREGSLLLETGRAPDADAALTEALYGGLAAGHDEYAAEALAKRLFLKVELLGDVEAGRRDLPLAEALAERMEPLPRVRARILNSEGVLFDRLGEPDRALALYDASIAARRDLEGADEDPELIYALLNVASVAREQGRYAASTRSLQDALPKLAALIGEANPNYARAQTTMAHNLLDEGRLAQAEAAARRSIEIVEQAVGEGSIDLWLPRWILGRVALSRRDDAAARAEFERSLAALERGPGLASPIAVRHLQGLGDARIAGGSFEAGLAEHRRAFAVVAEALGPDHPYTADAHRTVGDALLATSAVPEALAEYATALAIYERALGPEANQVAWTLERIGRAKRLGGDAAGAREALTRSLSLLEATLPEESPHIADVARELGELALTEGRVDDAESSLARAVAIYRGLRDQDDPTLAMTRFALARARAGRDREAARTLAGEARAALTAAGPKFSTEADEIGRWLASS